MAELDVRIGEVVTDLMLTEGVGALAPEEVNRLVALVTEHIRRSQDSAAQRSRDVTIGNSAYHSTQELSHAVREASDHSRGAARALLRDVQSRALHAEQGRADGRDRHSRPRLADPAVRSRSERKDRDGAVLRHDRVRHGRPGQGRARGNQESLSAAEDPAGDPRAAALLAVVAQRDVLLRLDA